MEALLRALHRVPEPQLRNGGEVGFDHEDTKDAF
jgi:hypothetical protein